ncbi:hypothetical protein ACWEWP_05125 [Streptomyces olivaceus]
MPAPAHPMANPGYGKRSVPDQAPVRAGAFGYLPPRECYVAAFVDRLPEGAAIDAKTLAKALPLYGQQAVRSALNELSRAGHLRRVRRRAGGGDGTGEGVIRWVFRTYWSPTARDSEWWARFLAGDAPGDMTDVASPAEVAVTGVRPEDTPQPEQPEQAELCQAGTVPPRSSVAYQALARLGRTEPRLALSAADCAALEELASAWLARGVTEEHLTRSLVAGLPEYVHSPRALLQRRLRDKMPPELPAAEARAPRILLECIDCGVPGRPEAFPDGLCLACRGTSRPPEKKYRPVAGADGARRHPSPLSADQVRLRADQIRSACDNRRNLAKPPRAVLEHTA